MARQPRPKQPAGPITVANTNNGPAVIAPWPLIDRYPTILGDRISIGYIGAIIRLCMSGYRQQWVDLLDELLVGEPHGYAVLEHRFNTVSGGRLDITPPELRLVNGQPNPESDEARLIAEDIASIVDAIPERQKALNRLAWGLYYGVSGAENIYEYRADGWRVVALNFIHSRRIAYPDQNSWRPRIWDQGSVSTSPDTNRSYPTTDMFGVRVDDFPGKFIVFEACIRGDYPTREGLGLQLAYWIGLKGMAVRGAGQYVERFGKPWALGSYSTSEPNVPKRAATDEDIKALNAALAALGLGSLAGAALPDSVAINLQGPGLNSGSTGITHAELIALIDAQIEEVVLTTSGITTPGKNGTRSSREVMKEGTRETFRYDAQCLADTLKRDLVMPLVRLRHPGKEHLCPNVAIFPNEEPNPLAILELNAKAAASGLPVDADAVAKKIGVDLIPAEKGAPPRRMYPVKPIEPIDLPVAETTEAGDSTSELDGAPDANANEDEPTDEESTTPRDSAAEINASDSLTCRSSTAHLTEEAPANAPMGQWAWPAYREGVRDRVTEAPTDTETKLYESLRAHFATKHVGLPESAARLLLECVANGWYAAVLHAPPAETLYRGLVVATSEQLASMLGTDVETIEGTRSKELGGTIPSVNGHSTSWTAKKKITKDFSGDGDAGSWAVTLIADATTNTGRWLTGPGGLYDVEGLCEFHLEKETVGIEPIVVRRVEWMRIPN